MEGLEELESMGLRPESNFYGRIGRVEKYVAETRKNCNDTCGFCSEIPAFLYTFMEGLEELKGTGLKPESTLLWKGWKS